jgi:hypothetical protein
MINPVCSPILHFKINDINKFWLSEPITHLNTKILENTIKETFVSVRNPPEETYPGGAGE